MEGKRRQLKEEEKGEEKGRGKSSKHNN